MKLSVNASKGLAFLLILAVQACGAPADVAQGAGEALRGIIIEVPGDDDDDDDYQGDDDGPLLPPEEGGKKLKCPLGTGTFELFSPGPGHFSDGTFSVVLSEYGTDSFKWSSRLGVYALHVMAGVSHNTQLFGETQTSGVGSSVDSITQVSHPLTFIRFCYDLNRPVGDDDDSVDGDDDDDGGGDDPSLDALKEAYCPVGTNPLVLYAPGPGRFTNGQLSVVLSDYTTDTFKWASNVGVTAVFTTAGPSFNADLFSEPHTSGMATSVDPHTQQSHPITFIKFCYDGRDIIGVGDDDDDQGDDDDDGIIGVPDDKKAHCPLGYVTFELFSPGPGLFMDGNLGVVLSEYGESSFKWSSSMEVEALFVNAGGTYNAYLYGDGATSGVGSSVNPDTQTAHPLTFLKFCYRPQLNNCDAPALLGDDDDDDTWEHDCPIVK